MLGNPTESAQILSRSGCGIVQSPDQECGANPSLAAWRGFCGPTGGYVNFTTLRRTWRIRLLSFRLNFWQTIGTLPAAKSLLCCCRKYQFKKFDLCFAAIFSVRLAIRLW